jgi:hypothetical protein
VSCFGEDEVDDGRPVAAGGAKADVVMSETRRGEEGLPAGWALFRRMVEGLSHRGGKELVGGAVDDENRAAHGRDRFGAAPDIGQKA